MTAPTHILFDFFGTLVRYAPHPATGYPDSYRWARDHGATVSYPRFLAHWNRTAQDYEARADADGREFTMAEVGAAFLAAVLPGSAVPAESDVDGFVARFVAEWATGIAPLDGLADLLAGLGARHRLAVVSNTNSSTLVPALLDRFGLRDRFEAVVLSVDVGWRKPHPAIYRAALRRLGIGPDRAVFVGDSYHPDFTGPTAAGIRSYLIDPGARHPVPVGQRLDSLLDLPGRLGGLDGQSASRTSR